MLLLTTQLLSVMVILASLKTPPPFAVVVLSPAAKKLYAARREREALEQSLLEQMNNVNAQADPHERMSFIAIVDGPWTIGNEFLTPTLKVKRAALENRYLPLAEKWKSLGAPVAWETELPRPAEEESPRSAAAPVVGSEK